jgi:IS5 family transposase
MVSGRRKGLTPTMRRELKRRSAIEAVIGHMKTDGRLDRNFLLGHDDDAINALLAADAHNLRLVLAFLILWCALIGRPIATFITALADPDTARRPRSLTFSMR